MFCMKRQCCRAGTHADGTGRQRKLPVSRGRTGPGHAVPHCGTVCRAVRSAPRDHVSRGVPRGVANPRPCVLLATSKPSAGQPRCHPPRLETCRAETGARTRAHADNTRRGRCGAVRLVPRDRGCGYVTSCCVPFATLRVPVLSCCLAAGRMARSVSIFFYVVGLAGAAQVLLSARSAHEQSSLGFPVPPWAVWLS
jgi:hypothetical protein